MAERLTNRVYRCPVHDPGYSDLSWFSLISVCRCVHVVCQMGTEGYHLHEIRIGDDAWSRVVITERRHEWRGGAWFVDVRRLREDMPHVESISAAWAVVGEVEDLGLAEPPAVVCQVDGGDR